MSGALMTSTLEKVSLNPVTISDLVDFLKMSGRKRPTAATQNSLLSVLHDPLLALYWTPRRKAVTVLRPALPSP